MPRFLTAKTSDGDTFAHYVGWFGRPDILSFLAEKKPEILIVKNKCDETPFDRLLPSLTDDTASLKRKMDQLTPRP